MKAIKTKRVNLVICWSGLRNTSPKEFPNIAEMEKTTDILAVLKKGSGEFAGQIEEGEDINTDIQRKGLKMDDEKAVKMRADFTARSTELEARKGSEIAKIEFEDAVYDIFVKQFERWGRVWFYKLEPYLEFRKDLLGDQAQAQPEEEEK